MRRAEHRSRSRAPCIVLLCPGIGHVRRGMERSVGELYQQLEGRLDAEWHLLTGSGPDAALGRPLPSFARERMPRLVTRARPLAALELEQLTFFVSCMPVLARLSPDVVYCRDRLLTRLLGATRSLLGRSTRVVYGNGSLMSPPFPRSFDMVQHLSRHGYYKALAAKEPREKQRFVPNAFRIPETFTPTSPDARSALRRRLGLPPDKRILLCVAAINRHHKRIDYLIREVATRADPDLVLLLVGEHEHETPGLIAEGRAALGERIFVARVRADEMEGYYRASDAFVLPSRSEAFGRVIVEAMSFGLAPFVHSGASFREIAGPLGRFVNMAQPGALAGALAAAEVWRDGPEVRAERHRWAWENYSWASVEPRYLEMFEAALARQGT